jgi:hypothetical protein
LDGVAADALGLGLVLVVVGGLGLVTGLGFAGGLELGFREADFVRLADPLPVFALLLAFVLA